MDGKLISIITPYTNKVIDGYEDGIKSQNYKNYELILVKDEEHLGAGATRNKGIKMAKGDILFFLDSDAVMKSDCLEELARAFTENNADLVSGMTLPYPNSNLLGKITGYEYSQRFFNIGNKFVQTAATTCLGIKKEVIEKENFKFTEVYKSAIGEDWFETQALSNKGYKIFHTNNVVIYHDTSDNVFHYLKRQFEHAKYRPLHSLKYKKIKDEYTSSDILVPSLFMLFLPFVIFLNIKEATFSWYLPIYIILIMLWNFNDYLEIYKNSKDLLSFLLIPLSFLRYFVWIAGAFFGILEVPFKWKKL